MIQRIYIEEELQDHPRVVRICERFKQAKKIVIDRYTEVFNRRGQNFRLQKKQPALILAKKHDHFVLKAPENFGIGSQNNYYFSHMYNCVYDCRYCFLQGMYQSAHYVLFVNYEDFLKEIKNISGEIEDQNYTFFSGYDCDSMALDSISGFCDFILPHFQKKNNANLEFRTKSVQIQSLLKATPSKQVVVAWSFTPHNISSALENQVPSVESRIRAMKEVANSGWPVGIRFDPLIHHRDWQMNYQKLFKEVFSNLNPLSVHSVSLGPLRFPKHIYSKISKLYPDDELFAHSLAPRDALVSYPSEIETNLQNFCLGELSEYVDSSKIFSCTPNPISL